MKNILIACEESQEVCKAFRKRGFNAYSCDIVDCSGDHPEWHIQGSALGVLSFPHKYPDLPQKWDLVIAHPPCTYISNSGVCWLFDKNGNKNDDRWDNLKKAILFFRFFQSQYKSGKIKSLAIENPIPHKYAREGFEDVEGIGKYSQIIQPWMFGHPESKATCLWLYGLPELKCTDIVKDIWKSLPKNQAQRLHYLPPGPNRAKLRSKTFSGIAKAMAEQWGDFLLNKM